MSRIQWQTMAEFCPFLNATRRFVYLSKTKKGLVYDFWENCKFLKLFFFLQSIVLNKFDCFEHFKISNPAFMSRHLSNQPNIKRSTYYNGRILKNSFKSAQNVYFILIFLLCSTLVSHIRVQVWDAQVSLLICIYKPIILNIALPTAFHRHNAS